MVSGIWPPDPGGPASHAPALADFLAERGHDVDVVTTADAEPAARSYPVRWAPRRSPLRHVRAALLVREASRRADVVYATSMIRRAAIGAVLARRPLVVKLVSDEVFERAAREGRYAGTLDAFQGEQGGVRTRVLRATRDRALRRARHVFSPSAYLRAVALGWGLEPDRVSVLPNPAPRIPTLPPREQLRAELGLSGDSLVFAGRLGPQKAVGVLLEALAAVPDVTLAVAGDGPERTALEHEAKRLGLDGRVTFLGTVARERVLRLFAAADASVLPSAWENFPHTVVEALAVGCPVISTAVGRCSGGGARRGERAAGLAGRSVGARLGDRALLRRRRVACPPLGQRRSFRRELWRDGGLRADRSRARAGDGVRKRLLMVGRSRYSLPLSPSLARKFDALSAELDVRVLASAGRGAGSDSRFTLVRSSRPRVLDGPSFYATLPFRVARELKSFRPDAVLAQGAQEAALCILGRKLARVRTRVIADIHGDPAAPARLYGLPRRKAFAPFADALARYGLRRSDGVRTISAYTSRLVRQAGVEPTAEFAAFMDLEPFVEAPPAPFPEKPVALFVGVLERYKAVDVLAEAWRRAAPNVPDATLHLVGRGALREIPQALVRELPEQTRWSEALTTPEVARALDESTVLVLPSRSEGLGRVVVEAFCRGRGVVGSRVGGIPDIVEDDVSGVLVPPENADALADALVRTLSDRNLAERLGAAAHEAVQPWLATTEEYARRIRELVDEVTSTPP